MISEEKSQEKSYRNDRMRTNNKRKKERDQMKTEMEVTVITPKQILYKAKANDVSCVTSNGMLDIFPGHQPFVGTVLKGTCKIKSATEEKIIPVFDGMIQILEDRVIVLIQETE